MSFFFFLSYFLSITLSQVEFPPEIYTCSSDPCYISPRGNSIAICTNKFSKCTIDCSKPHQCEFSNGPLIIYSGSPTTIIQCDNIDSCVSAQIYIGIPLQIPNGYTINDFNGNKLQARIDCSDESACKESWIIYNGYFINGVTTVGYSKDSIKEGYIYCKLGVEQQCNLYCGERHEASCDNVYFLCQGGICRCNGQSCPLYTYIQTASPTISSGNPTPKPTNIPSITPTGKPSYNPTKSTTIPTSKPTIPTFTPTTGTPTLTPITNNPSTYPTIIPTKLTLIPSITPTKQPTFNPSINPTKTPTNKPTYKPSNYPSIKPSFNPTYITIEPTIKPTNNPITNIPTINTIEPTLITNIPTIKPTMITLIPTIKPTHTQIRYRPRGGDIIVCTNEYSICVIDCSRIKQCSFNNGPLIVYSGSMNTYIYCTNVDSCEQAKFIIGIPDNNDIPNGYSKSDFIGIKNEVKIYCTKDSSCKQSQIWIQHKFNSNVVVQATNADSFKSGIFTCNIAKPEKCILTCGSNNAASCDQLSYYCSSTNCICNGNSCPIIELKTISPTNSATLNPTLITKTPSNIPTSITNIPTINNSLLFKKNNNIPKYIYIVMSISGGIVLIICCISLFFKLNYSTKFKQEYYNTTQTMINSTNLNNLHRNTINKKSKNDKDKNMNKRMLSRGSSTKFRLLSNDTTNYGSEATYLTYQTFDDNSLHNGTLELESGIHSDIYD